MWEKFPVAKIRRTIVQSVKIDGYLFLILDFRCGFNGSRLKTGPAAPLPDHYAPKISVTAAEPAPADESTETTAAAIETPSAPTSLPKETSGDEPEPVTTGSLNVESDGAALVWYPDVETSIVSAAQSEE